MRGKLLGGRYEILGVLAVGGFGQTYIALDMHRPGNPQCVVKHLQPTNANSRFLQNARRLFQTEAEILEKLGHHDQIPRLLAYFEENQEFYLVQEYIQGHTLTAQLQPGKRWSENEVFQLLQEILGILVFVHDRGAIHRDIKPDNIIRRSSDGKLVLVDFGSVKQAWTQVITAKEQTHSIFANHLSATIAIGTPGYMPTEQGRGKPQPNSDIYALGMIAIQALTGITPTQLLEESETGEIVWRHQAKVSEAIAFVITKMVRYNYKNRYQTASEALAAVEKLKLGADKLDVQPSLSTSSPPSPPQTFTHNPRLPATSSQHVSVPVETQKEKSKFSCHTQLATYPDPLTTQPTVFVRSEHQTELLNRNSTQSAESSTNHTPQQQAVIPTAKQLPIRIGAIITAMLTSVVAIYALKWTPKANTYSQQPTQTVEKECVQATTQTIPECRLERARQLAAGENFQAAIATAQQIPQTDADYPAARQLIAQSSNSLLDIATNHYRSGQRVQAIALAKNIPQNSPIYQKAQETIKQWNKQLQVQTRPPAPVPPKSTAKISVTPVRNQTKPIQTAKKPATKTVANKPKVITRRASSVISRQNTTKPRQITVTRRSIAVPKRTSAARQLSRTVPRRLPRSLAKPAASAQRPTRIVYKRVTRSSVKRTSQITRKQVKRVTKIERRVRRSYRWVTKTVR